MPDNNMPDVDLTQEQHGPGEYPFWQDLNPNFLAGENYGEQGPHPEKTAHTAYDVKGVHDHLRNINDSDLKQVPILPPGSRLEQGGTYIDLRQAQPEEFSATGGMTAGPDNWYVPKSSVPYWIWNQLIGVQNPERLDQADDSSTGPAGHPTNYYKADERTQHEFVVAGQSNAQTQAANHDQSSSDSPQTAGHASAAQPSGSSTGTVSGGTGEESSSAQRSTGGTSKQPSSVPDTGVPGWPNPEEDRAVDRIAEAMPAGWYVSDSADPEHDPLNPEKEY